MLVPASVAANSLFRVTSSLEGANRDCPLLPFRSRGCAWRFSQAPPSPTKATLAQPSPTHPEVPLVVPNITSVARLRRVSLRGPPATPARPRGHRARRDRWDACLGSWEARPRDATCGMPPAECDSARPRRGFRPSDASPVLRWSWARAHPLP